MFTTDTNSIFCNRTDRVAITVEKCKYGEIGNSIIQRFFRIVEMTRGF